MFVIVKRLRWLLFFTNGEREQVRQGLRRERFENEKVHGLLKELG